MSYRSILLLSVTTISLCVPWYEGARAQNADQGPAAGAATGNAMEEIVVSARRREERVQSIPLAITAFSQADVEHKHIQQLSDLLRSVPSLDAQQDNSDANSFYANQVRLRGLPGSEVYFADVPLGSTDPDRATGVSRGTSFGYYYDLDHVEVDKGPQGTLFGKNSVGGQIVIEPKKPTNDFEGYGKVTLGNYADKEVEGAVNVPIVEDKVLLRVAGQMQKRDGYTKDISNGKDYDNRNYYAWRVGLTVRPTDDLENYFLYDGYYQHTNGNGYIPSFINPNFTFAGIPIPGVNPDPKHPGKFLPVPLTLANGPSISALSNPATQIATYEQLLAANAAGKEATLSFFPNLPQLLAEQQKLGVRAVLGRSIQGLGKDYFYGFTNTTNWNITDDLTLKNIAAARVFKSLSTVDESGFPVPLLTIGDPGNQTGWNDNTVQYTEELQLQGKALNDKLSWVLGGYLELDHPLGDILDASTAVGSTGYYHYKEVQRSQAVFAHGIYDLGDYVDGLRFTAGYRYTWDYYSLTERGTDNVDAVVLDPKTGKPNCAQLAEFDARCISSTNAHFSSFGWNVGLDDQIAPGTMVYVRAGNAYRPGAANPQVPSPYNEFKPEHVTDVEIGVKSDWDLMGIHGRTNFDVFHTDYKAIQVSQLVGFKDAQGNPKTGSLVTNAAAASIDGGELEGTIMPLPGVEFSPHAAYLYTHFDKYPSVFTTGSAPPFLYDPKWVWGFTGTYHLPLDASLGDIALSATYTWYGQQYVAPSDGKEIFPIMPSYDNLDVRIDWTDMFGYTVDGAFFMTNATDNTHVSAVIPIYGQLGYTSLVYNEPRMFGFSVKYRFGGPSEEPAAVAAPYTPPPVTAVAPAPKSYLVFFDFNKSDLTGQATQIVDQAASNAGPAKVTRLTVTGHTDTVGSDAYNMRLSRRRAESVASRLEKDGIPSSEIEIVAKGKRDLLVPTADGFREPQNRRVQIVYDGGPTS